MLRPTVNRPVCHGVWVPRPGFCYCQTVAGLLMWGALSDVRMGLLFTSAAGHRQRSHSQVRVLRNLWPYFTVSNSRLPQPGGPGPCIYIPQEQGGPDIPQDTLFLFVVSYGLQGYAGGIRTLLHTGIRDWISSQFYIQSQFVPHRKHTDSPLLKPTG
jgi:hypothetical protein